MHILYFFTSEWVLIILKITCFCFALIQYLFLGPLLGEMYIHEETFFHLVDYNMTSSSWRSAYWVSLFIILGLNKKHTSVEEYGQGALLRETGNISKLGQKSKSSNNMFDSLLIEMFSFSKLAFLKLLSREWPWMFLIVVYFCCNLINM